jgi:hypothetical protein
MDSDQNYVCHLTCSVKHPLPSFVQIRVPWKTQHADERIEDLGLTGGKHFLKLSCSYILGPGAGIPVC